MNIYEYGKKNQKVLLLLHPAVVMWDYFSEVIPLLEKEYHLIIPALPGYDKETKEDFSSIEQIAKELIQWLEKKGYQLLHGIYGCSMGGSIAIRMMVELASTSLVVKNILLDGAITPYQLPYWLTRLIAIRDFLMVSIGKRGGRKFLIKAFSGNHYEEEELKSMVDYLSDVLNRVTYKTIWRTFDSCNNYSMPKQPLVFIGALYYWYADSEKKARKWDIQYMQKQFPQTIFTSFLGLGHGGLAIFNPTLFLTMINQL